MFSIFKKRKKVTVDCFTYHIAVEKEFPISKAVNFYPDWFKKLKTTYIQPTNDQNKVEYPRSTIKMCEGFRDYYSQGFVIPLWSDLILNIKKNEGYDFLFSAQNDILCHIEHHNHNEYGNMFNKYIHGKIISPWLISEKSGIKFMWTEPKWNMVKYWSSINIVPGVCSYNLQSTAHINMFFSNENKKIKLLAGQPLAHIIPITENEIDLKVHLLEKKDYEKLQDLNSYTSKFVGKYKYRQKANSNENK